MNTMKFSELGEVGFVPPSDLLTVSDIVLTWGSSRSDQGKLARAGAAAIGVCWPRDHKPRPPIYDSLSGEVMAYGGQVLAWAMKRGESPYTIATAGSALVGTVLLPLLPTAEALEEAEGNSEPTATDTASG